MKNVPLVTESVLAGWRQAGLRDSETLWGLASKADRDRLAVICPRNGLVSYGTLLDEAECLAATWFADGIAPGDIVMLQIPNWYEFVLAHLALSRLGAITLPTLPLYRERELTYIAGTSGARAIVGAPDQAGCPPEALYQRLLDLPQLRHFWRADDLRAAATGDPSSLPPPPEPDDVTIVMATSGTTGEPKLILHSHRSTVGGVLQRIAQEMTLDAGDVMFMPSPISHATGLQYGVRMSIVVGATLLLQQRWEPHEAAALIARHKARWAMGATPFLFDLVGLPKSERESLSSLGLFVCGGAPVPESLAAEATEALPQVSLMAAWGMSETGIVTLVRPGDPIGKVTGSDGRPVPGWEVRVASPGGEPIPVGQEGEIQCRGAALFEGYLGRQDLTQEAVPDGWLRSGDIGRMDGDGYLRCLGRIKDLIIRGGVNLSATEIEDAVRLHPAIRDVAVIGAPDPRLGERVCAVVVADGELPTVLELGKFLLAQGLAKQKLPESIVLVDALPATATGKIQKHLLRARLSAET